MCAARMVSVQVSHLLPGITTGGVKPSHHLYKHGKSCAPCNKKHGSIACAFVVANFVQIRAVGSVSPNFKWTRSTELKRMPRVPKYLKYPQNGPICSEIPMGCWRMMEKNKYCLLDLVPMTFIQIFGRSASHENDIRYSGNTYNTVYNVQDIKF